ncbi:MAG: PDZ domain-containing protein [Thermoanaerobaculia bacterium]
MKRAGCEFGAALVLSAGVFLCGCAGSRPSAQASSGKAGAEPAGRCEGTLGLEVVPVSRQLRRTLALPQDFRGAVVGEVLPGGPAAAAGIRPSDVVEAIGEARIGNDCDFAAAAYNLSCEPVRVVVRRDGAAVESTLVPVDQKPFLDESCRDGVSSACFRQAWLLWRTDRDGALELYDAACRAGSAEACAYEGLRLMDSPDRGHDAAAALERSCELGSGAGCAHLAFLHATGKLVKKDDRRATALYVQGCDLGDARGCYNVGLMADEGRGTARDISRAAAKYDEACELGSSTACTNLGFLYENGRGIEQDKGRAVELYQRGCDGTRCQPSNLGGCVNVGRAYRDRIGVEKDAARAASIFQEACGRTPDPDDIHSDTNGSRACSLLGGLYLAGDGVELDLTMGRELSELGCDRGDSFGCFNAAVVYTNGSGVEADAAKAASFLERACEGGDGEGCYDLGVAYARGNGVTRDRGRATELLRKACGLGFERACAKKKR